MSMQGIDVSSHQTGINLATVPCDFVICKATEGTSYVNPDCDRAYQQAKTAGKCLGVYHYASGGDPTAEADYFLSQIKGYIGEALLALDWESYGNSAFGVNDFNWCKTWLERVHAKTGVKPLLYVSQSIMGKFNGLGDYGLWIAQYADMNSTGYQSAPWNEGAYSCAIRQYSSRGRLTGYGSDLDLNKFYGNRAAWNKYAGKGDAVKPKQFPGNAVNDFGLYYRAHCQTVGLLDPVHDGQVCGTVGYGKRLEGLYIDIRKIQDKYPDAKLKCKAHVQGAGWKDYTNVEHNTLIGTTGQSKRLEAIELEMTGLPADKVLMYRTHLSGKGWTDWIKGGFTSGTIGISKAIEAIQIKIE